MNILHIVRTPLSVKSFMLPFFRAQVRQGHLVALACNADEDASSIEALRIPVYRYHFKRSFGIINLYEALKSLRRIVSGSQFDLVIVHMPMAAAVGRLAVKFSSCRAKIIYVAHGLPCGPNQSKLRWLFWFVVEWLLGRITDAIFVMNSYDYDLARRMRMIDNPRFIRRIPGMGVDLKRFCSYQKSSRENFWRRLGISKKKVVLFAARFIREKGIFELLEAAKLLAQKECAFVLLGDGPENESISQLISQNNLFDSVFTFGWLDDISEFMKKCDIFVLPTYYFEGMPVTIMEAMACGKPVVSTRHRGPEDEVIDGETGFLVDVRNSAQLAEKIDLILNDEALAARMGKAGRLRAENLFSIEHAVESFCNEVYFVCDIRQLSGYG